MPSCRRSRTNRWPRSIAREASNATSAPKSARPTGGAATRTWPGERDEAVAKDRVPRLMVTAYVTGWVEAGPEILLDSHDPRLPERERHRRWVPSIAYRDALHRLRDAIPGVRVIHGHEPSQCPGGLGGRPFRGPGELGRRVRLTFR